MIIKIPLIILSLSTLASSYDCKNLITKKNINLCNEMVEKKISSEYAYKFITQEKSNLRDGKTIELIAPKEIQNHKKKEKKANNNLLKHLDFAKKHLKEHEKTYDFVERKFNVDREIIVGILLKETIIGNYKPKHDAYTTLNTVYQESNNDTKRNKWLKKLSKNNLIHLSKYCYENKITPKECSFPSSYIGAIGIPQFMPMNLYLARSIDNKKPDLTNLDDAIVSVGNYFNVIANYKKLIDWNKIPNVPKIEEKWYEYEFLNKKSSFASSKKRRKCFSCGNNELAEMSKYIKKIMRYNNSSNYAVGVFRIAWELHKYRNIN